MYMYNVININVLSGANLCGSKSKKIRHDKKHIALLWSKHAFVYLLAVSITTVPLCIMIIVGCCTKLVL